MENSRQDDPMYQIKPGFMLRVVAGNPVVVAVGPAAAHFHGIINLNQTGAMLWRRLEQGASRDQLVQALQAAYDVDTETASQDAGRFLATVCAAGFVE